MSIASRTVVFGVCTLGLMAVYAPVVRALAIFARENPTASHIVAVPFVTLALILENRRAIFASVRPSLLGGAALVVVGLGPALAGPVLGTFAVPSSLGLLTTGLIVSWIGLFVMCYGVGAARVALFPLTFLAFAIPIPPAVINGATGVLKSASTETVAGLFTLTGTPYHREGFVFALPTFVIEVADECSGIRSSIALVLTGLLVGHISLRSSWLQAMFVLAIIPVAIFKNGLRIAALSLLAIHSDPSFLAGRLHHEGGIVFFLLALAMLAPLLTILRRMDKVGEAPAV